MKHPKHPFLIDITDEDNWLYKAKALSKEGVVIEEMHTLSFPEGPRRRFAFTESYMHPVKDASGVGVGVPPHEHTDGFETFFVESGGLDFFINGKQTYVEPGSILHLQPYQPHAMVFHDLTIYRGVFHDWDALDDVGALIMTDKYNPKAVEDDAYNVIVRSKSDMQIREPAYYTLTPVEQVAEVRHPDRALVTHKLDGITMKMLTGRWENAGACELWRFELDAGVWAKWVQYPENAEFIYVQSGSVEFTVFGETFTAGASSLVKLPRYAPRSLKVLEPTALYDLAGITRWQALIQDYASISAYEPERAADPETLKSLKKRFDCYIESYGR
jgi:quercetin dioxygenase-like cupin family protein